MFTEQQIADFRESQYCDFQKRLSIPDEEETVKCMGCFEIVALKESQFVKMHDINNGLEQDYCNDCIENYKNENL